MVMPASRQFVYLPTGDWWDTLNDVPAHLTITVAGYDSIVEAILGDLFCGCGQVDIVVAALIDYLTVVASNDDAHARDQELIRRFPDPVLRTLLAYTADALDLTEHGGSVGGAWITQAGRSLVPPPPALI